MPLKSDKANYSKAIPTNCHGTTSIVDSHVLKMIPGGKSFVTVASGLPGVAKE